MIKVTLCRYFLNTLQTHARPSCSGAQLCLSAESVTPVFNQRCDITWPLERYRNNTSLPLINSSLIYIQAAVLTLGSLISSYFQYNSHFAQILLSFSPSSICFCNPRATFDPQAALWTCLVLAEIKYIFWIFVLILAIFIILWLERLNLKLCVGGPQSVGQMHNSNDV